MQRIGVDLGGTKVRSALVSAGILFTERRVFPDPMNDSEVLQIIEEVIRAVVEKAEGAAIGGIGMGIPAIPDGVKGQSTTLVAPNLPVLLRCDLKAHLESIFGMHVEMENDANCFIAGEHHFGAARGISGCIGLTLGTGIGLGILLEGRVRRGATWHCGEIWDVPLDDGRYLEDVLSGAGVARRAGTASAAKAALSARQGNANARTAWTEYGHRLGWLLAFLQRVIDPQCYVLGGSIRDSLDLFEADMRKAAGPLAPIKMAELGESAVILGATIW
ncbi:MAG: ROK family protein [Armatimonadetes bacterium]|nr:ROK family protein [Armatimonadota bacterium]